MVRVLFVTNMFPNAADPVSGIFVKEQIDEISRRGDIDFDVYVIDGIGGGKIEYLKSMLDLPRRIAAGRYDVIHVHYGLSALFLLRYTPEARVFLTLHGADILEEQGHHVQVFLTKKILPKVDRVFIVSEEMEPIVRPLTDHCEFLPCGVDTEFFRPSAPTQNRGSRPLIVFPNSPLREVKNFPLFEETLEVLNGRVDPAYETASIDGLTREGVRDLLNRADCLLMTSRSEGSPQVVKEAMSCGTPVVSVPVGDVPSLLADVPSCHTARAMDDPAELAELVADCLAAAVGREAVREAFIRKGRYGADVVAERLLAEYASPT